MKNKIAKPTKFLLFNLMLISAFSQASSDLYLPSLIAISKSLSTDAHSVQFSIAVYMMGLSASILLYGPLSDGIGRRKPLILGFLL